MQVAPIAASPALLPRTITRIAPVPAATDPVVPVRTSATVDPVASSALPDPIAPTTDPVSPSADPPATNPPDRARGMLRNLASGHFNAVADLRHRMQFAEEIKAAGLVLPEPPQPRGNGRAFERLLAAYAPSQPAPTPAAEVDRIG